MELITKYFPDLTPIQLEQFNSLLALYEDWNSKINVISRKDMDKFYCNHVLHSLSIAKIKTFTHEDSVLDIGTGGGFPGIPLAILFPETQFTLVDSIKKKTKVVQEVANALELKNVTVINDRFENLTDQYDFIVSRAVASATKLVRFTKNALKETGSHIFMKGGDLALEKAELLATYRTMKWDETPLVNLFEPEFFETKKLIILSKA
ncbi:MAG: 16S rRNA (guanine(527)-N(7))-methyltransferase RsmG [Bacteroidetes bacterium]|nr:MAG: 16S rRNA (guanine(527)-N(7))-methyltransferase RsmG [Bacteroidota bacterium]